jgi:hypothetical protein
MHPKVSHAIEHSGVAIYFKIRRKFPFTTAKQGQDDDITVLTITRLATGAESPLSSKTPYL